MSQHERTGPAIIRRPSGGCKHWCQIVTIVEDVTGVVCIGLGIYFLIVPTSDELVAGLFLIAIGCIFVVVSFISSCCICCFKPSTKSPYDAADQRTVVTKDSTHNDVSANQFSENHKMPSQPAYASPPLHANSTPCS